jgi:hypothetical protein
MTIATKNQKLQEIIDAEFTRLTRELVEATAITRDGTRTTVTVEVARIPDGEYAGEPVHIDCSTPVDILEFDGRRFERHAHPSTDRGVITYWAESGGTTP